MAGIKDDIKNLDFKNAYLLWGEEAYLRDHYKSMIVKKVIDPDFVDFNYLEYTTKQPDNDEIADYIKIRAENERSRRPSVSGIAAFMSVSFRRQRSAAEGPPPERSGLNHREAMWMRTLSAAAKRCGCCHWQLTARPGCRRPRKRY